MRAFAILLSLMGGAAFLVEEAWSTTIHVPGDYSTIYAALDAASSGDIVEVAPGTYDQFDTRPSWWYGGNVSAVGFLKDGVTLQSSGGPAVTTLRLDSSTAKPVILIGDSGELNVTGFSFTGSVGDLIAIAVQTSDGPGALNLHNCIIRDYGVAGPKTHESAIDTYNVAVDIQDCLFANIDSPTTVAVYFYGGQAIVEDCSFKNCSGGSISFATVNDPDESLIVRRSFFENNGYDITADRISSLIVEDSWMAGNSAGIYSEAANVAVRNCTLAGGHGMSCQAAHAEFTGNTFYNGSNAIQFFGYGAPSSVLFERNIFSFCTGEPAVQVGFVVIGSVTTSCNVFWQNAGENTQGYSLGPTDLIADPQFCGAPAQDFTLYGSSPCLPQNNNGCGQIGAWGFGCGPVSVEPSSWGQIKALYR